MKTRFFFIMVVFLFAIAPIAKATNNTPENSSVASSHESNTGIEMIYQDVLYDSALLDEWILTRDTWEQEDQENGTMNDLEASQILEEWVTSRENWENEGSESDKFVIPVDPTILEEWNASCENWEQK
jgi:hypothetical protein